MFLSMLRGRLGFCWKSSVQRLRYYSTKGEQSIAEKLKNAFQPTQLQVEDISGGCGSMYQINITSEAFRGKPLVKQHRMVNEVLQEDIKNMHGLQLVTKSR
ncbi:eukaryotic protein [Schizosaccharomyces japonicus yFS275]|uniref:Eukaryotic protein n=1 Tax=Schizosaccharomyces japonicus (strain yFS275 / FY16936) TaxID=402676 RepID=B6JZV7_SCHJY|nr:eukaryotic protein [Schizosaccharomyces japonicus yFS275]EEB06107.1 eukaryotic protein [Schizosaccharomyces japonicus yFS275]